MPRRRRARSCTPCSPARRVSTRRLNAVVFWPATIENDTRQSAGEGPQQQLGRLRFFVAHVKRTGGRLDQALQGQHHYTHAQLDLLEVRSWRHLARQACDSRTVPHSMFDSNAVLVKKHRVIPLHCMFREARTDRA